MQPLETPVTGNSESWLVRDCATAAMLRATDWSATPLGPIDAWPESLRIAVGICLNSRFPMFVWWGPDLINIYNDAYIPVLGERHPAAFGRPAQPTWHEIWHVVGPQADLVMTRGEATWNDRVLLVMERHGFPEETYFTWSYSPIPDGRGGIGGLFCACTEDTPRVFAERERDRLAAQRKLALDAARMGWWHYDPVTDLATWDQRYAEIFGVSGTQLPNDEILRRLHPDDLPAVRARVEQALDPAVARPYSAEYRVLRDDGAVRWVEAHGLATFAGDGADRHAVSFVGTVADVTDRRRAADRIDRIHAAAAALSAALTADDVARVALEQGVAGTGATAGSLALLTPDAQALEMVGMSGYPPDVVARWQRFPIDAPIALADAFRRAQPVFLTTPEERLRHYPALAGVTADRATRASVCLPLLVGGRAVGVLGLSFDEPGAIAIEDRDLLVTLARQCGQALERARLFEAERAARAEAERAGRMKDEFLATLSHELRTPLNAILGWAQILRGGAATAPRVPPDVAEGLEVIERNARAQTRIIEDLLDMSRIISGKVRLDVQRVDLHAVIAAAIETVRPAADARGVHVLPALAPSTDTVTGDAARLQQVFWNLLSNAVKFTPRGGRVQILLDRVDTQLEVSIVDTGEGIPPSFLPHVFDRFRQADGGTTRRHGGLGLGLAIVKQLVELHGGRVLAKSAGLGLGATFVVCLPLSAEHPETPAAADAGLPENDAVPVIEDTCVRIAGLRVLVVDDEPDARDMVRRLLADCGAIVATAASVTEALDLIESQRPDVLVSDIGMPGEDGYALIRRVRALPPDRGGQTPAVALTAYARAEDRMKAVLAGFQHHVVKPVEAAELLTMVASLGSRPT